MIMRVRCVQRCVPCPRGREGARSPSLGDSQRWGDLQQVRGALLVERAYWLVTCEIVTSGPRSPRVAAVPPRLVPRAMEIPGNSDFLTMDFVVDVSS